MDLETMSESSLRNVIRHDTKYAEIFFKHAIETEELHDEYIRRSLFGFAYMQREICNRKLYAASCYEKRAEQAKKLLSSMEKSS